MYLVTINTETITIWLFVWQLNCPIQMNRGSAPSLQKLCLLLKVLHVSQNGRRNCSGSLADSRWQVSSVQPTCHQGSWAATGAFACSSSGRSWSSWGTFSGLAYGTLGWVRYCSGYMCCSWWALVYTVLVNVLFGFMYAQHIVENRITANCKKQQHIGKVQSNHNWTGTVCAQCMVTVIICFVLLICLSWRVIYKSWFEVPCFICLFVSLELCSHGKCWHNMT